MSTTVMDLTKIISPGFTDDVLRNILKKKSKFHTVTVRRINLKPSSNKGDSYLSTITRFTIEASGNDGSGCHQNFQVHVIVKCIPRVLAWAKTFRSKDFFECELAFYDKVWPTLDTFQKSKNLQETFDSIPLCLATYSDGNNDFIALEDLSYEGYVAIDRSSGLDLDTTLFILKHFAQFHATAVAYRDQYPEKFEEMASNLKETYFHENFRKWYIGALNNFFVVIKDAARKELPIQYLEKINEVTQQDVYGNICKQLTERTPLCTITHGDCWAPNFLVKQTDKGKNLALIDFQLMRCASLATDVLFLLYTCVDSTVRDQHWNLLLKEYLESFVNTLHKLGSKINVTLEMLQEEMKKSGLFAFGMCSEALIMSLMEEEDVADLDGLGNEEKCLHEVWKIEPIKDENKRKRVAGFVKHLIDNSLI